MSEKNEAIAESIIRVEATSFTTARIVGTQIQISQARTALKDRLLKELDLAEYRGSHP